MRSAIERGCEEAKTDPCQRVTETLADNDERQCGRPGAERQADAEFVPSAAPRDRT